MYQANDIEAVYELLRELISVRLNFAKRVRNEALTAVRINREIDTTLIKYARFSPLIALHTDTFSVKLKEKMFATHYQEKLPLDK